MLFINKGLGICVILFTLLCSTLIIAQVEDKIELETTIIKGNTELPKILYIVPWQDNVSSEIGEQSLVLHSLFGDILRPVAPKEAFLGITKRKP